MLLFMILVIDMCQIWYVYHFSFTTAKVDILSKSDNKQCYMVNEELGTETKSL